MHNTFIVVFRAITMHGSFIKNKLRKLFFIFEFQNKVVFSKTTENCF